jgi:ADP-heptose:LPS heptosyltransferase
MKILIIRNDGIGDLVIFNYFLSQIKFNPNDEIHFCISCNTDSINYFKPQCIVKWFKFQRPARFNLIQLFRFYSQIIKIKLKNYDQIIIPVSSKNNYLLRYINHLNASKIITFKTDDVNSSDLNVVRYNYFCLDPKTYSELEKSFVLNQLLSNKFGYQFLGKKLLDSIKSSDNPNIMIAPFASSKERTWPMTRWITFFEYLNNQENLTFISIIASSSQAIEFNKILDINYFQNLTFSFLIQSNEIISKLSSCSLFIGMDSAPAHIAVLNNVYSIILTNGNHYGRFFPYIINKRIHPNPLIIIPNDLKKLSVDERIQKTKYNSGFAINNIQSKELIEAVKSRKL